MSAKKNSELESKLAEMNKDSEDGSVVSRFADINSDVQVIPTGILSLDTALGCGGIPRKRITEFYGPNSSGKTTSLLCAIANVQAEGGEALFIDAEQRFDPKWAAANGVDTDKLIFSQPSCGEDALQKVEKLLEHVDIAVVDSVAALVPRAEIEGEIGDQFMGLQARLMGQALRKLSGVVSRSNAALIFTNQMREKIGVVFGNPETTPGGKALSYWASVRADLRKISSIKEGDKVVGARTRVKIIKNSCAPPFAEAEFDFYYGVCSCHAKGPDRFGDMVDVAEAKHIIQKSGSWYSFNGEQIGQGRVNAAAFLQQNPQAQSAILAALKESAV